MGLTFRILNGCLALNRTTHLSETTADYLAVLFHTFMMLKWELSSTSQNSLQRMACQSLRCFAVRCYIVSFLNTGLQHCLHMDCIVFISLFICLDCKVFPNSTPAVLFVNPKLVTETEHLPSLMSYNTIIKKKQPANQMSDKKKAL